ncbi:hypothetical protein BpHYR1_033741 [Brachionus plicatilis]|uniref:Uncharacterized protein n=1 Tax=Brachionus plicatilis TaxID=10195 RepID=A0A3M7T2H8_BRAPC|nr:hypothetical protein BpHYR1_033741 [Brachionus plicatilis]
MHNDEKHQEHTKSQRLGMKRSSNHLEDSYNENTQENTETEEDTQENKTNKKQTTQVPKRPYTRRKPLKGDNENEDEKKGKKSHQNEIPINKRSEKNTRGNRMTRDVNDSQKRRNSAKRRRNGYREQQQQQTNIDAAMNVNDQVTTNITLDTIEETAELNEKRPNSDNYRSQLYHELERKYRRNRYMVLIHEKSIEAYSANIFERLNELKRSTGVTNPKMILPIIDKKTEVTSLKVAVDNYSDFIKLLEPWPQSAFKTGVRVEALPPNLGIVINNVDTELSGNNTIKKIEHRYQISGLEKI